MRATSRPRSVSVLAIVRRISPVEIWGQPKRSCSICACVPLPAPGAPTRMTINPFPFIVLTPTLRLALRARDPPAAQPPAARSEEPVVVAHDELRLDLLHRVHRDADDDEKARAAELEVQTRPAREPGGDDVRAHRLVDRRPDPRDELELDALDHDLGDQHEDCEVERADRRQPRQDPVEVVGRPLTGAYARDELAV